jgi:predicted transcriptional regulator
VRTLVDLPKEELDRLAELAARRGLSRAALMREALEDFLARHPRPSVDTAFGLWSDEEDGLAYQERLRGEW